MKKTFKVTVKTRMFHGILHETMERFGMNQAKLAEYLGMNYNSVGHMLRMTYVPKFSTDSGKLIKQKLEELTEMTVEELFPEHVFTEKFLKTDKFVQITKGIPVELLSNASLIYELPVPPDEQILRREYEEAVAFVFSTLTEQQVVVLHERFVNDKTLEEIGATYGVRRERIRQIESKAMRLLRSPVRLRLLRGELTEDSPLVKTWNADLTERRRVFNTK